MTMALWTAFFGTLSVVILWEACLPRRIPARSLRKRWTANLAFQLLNTGLDRLLGPLTGAAFAGVVAERGWGLLNLTGAPLWVALVVSVVGLDLNRYLVHRLMHWLPLLWRVHRLHHSDPDFDVTTQFRFHPLEAVPGGAFGVACIALLGLPPVGVLLHGILAAAVGFLQHGNVRYPWRTERFARALVVTPEMHRIHHSVAHPSRNFGAIFPWWDRWLGTYLEHPRESQETMPIGLEGYPDRRALGIAWMLAEPFLAEVSEGFTPATARTVANDPGIPISR